MLMLLKIKNKVGKIYKSRTKYEPLLQIKRLKTSVIEGENQMEVKYDEDKKSVSSSSVKKVVPKLIEKY